MFYKADFENKVIEVFESNRDFFERIAADGNLLYAVKEVLWQFVPGSLTKDTA